MANEDVILQGHSDLEKGAYLGAIASIATADREASEEEIAHIEQLCDAAQLSQQQKEYVVRAATELTGEDADIRRLDMEVTVEVSLVPVHPFPDKVGQGAKIGEAAFLKQLQSFRLRDPFRRQYFLANPVQTFLRCPYDRLNLGLCAHNYLFYYSGSKVRNCLPQP